MDVPTALRSLRAFLDSVEKRPSLLAHDGAHSVASDSSFINDYLRTFV
jgi:hypothetical protein